MAGSVRDVTPQQNPSGTFLVHISGVDHPGISAGLMQRLDDADATIQDVEQIIIRGQLSLSLVVEVPGDHDLLKELLLFGWQEKVIISFEAIDSDPIDRKPGLIVTLVGAHVSPAEFGAVAEEIASAGGNIDRIIRLARYPVMAFELVVSGANLADVRDHLLVRAKALDVDIAVQREGLERQAHRLIVLDVDSTLIRDEVIELIADEAGKRAEVEAITKRAMAGELDFEDSLHQRVALLEGISTDVMDRVRDQVRLTPGARTFVRTLRRLGYRTAIVSGGFTVVTDHLARELGINHAYANQLEVHDGVLTGRVTGRIVDRKGKADLLCTIAELEGVPLSQVVAVGDGANDLDMLNAAGLGIAFNAKPIVQNAADTAINVPYLDAILFLLGIRREDIDAADNDLD